MCNVARVRGSCIMNVSRRGSRGLGMEANDLSDGRSLCYGRFPDKAHLIGCHRRDDGGIIPIAIGCPLIIGVVELDEQGPAAEDFQHCSLIRRDKRAHDGVGGRCQRLTRPDDLMRVDMQPECCCHDFPIRSGEAEAEKEEGLGAALRVCKIQEIAGDLLLRDGRHVRMWNLHRTLPIPLLEGEGASESNRPALPLSTAQRG